MIILQYFDGVSWSFVAEFPTEHAAWTSLGMDYKGYRTVTKDGTILNSF